MLYRMTKHPGGWNYMEILEKLVSSQEENSTLIKHD